MSFICAICRDLLKISEEVSSHQRTITNSNTNSTSSNNVPARRKEKSNSIVATKCGHLFHYPCLSVWLSQSMNLTSESIMRCPSCKQLIYIYELIQLFPVESGGGSATTLEQFTSFAFQQKLKCAAGQLEDLIRDLGKKTAETDSPKKGNETPTRLQRARDSPKKLQASQLLELMKGVDSLRGSIKELNSLVEQHVEWGSVLEKHSREISELKSRNEELKLANEELKSKDAIGHEGFEDAICKDENSIPEIIGQAAENVQTTHAQDITSSTNAAQVSLDLVESSEPHQLTSSLRNSNGTSNSSPSSTQNRRKSVTFMDPFDEFHEKTDLTNANIPFETRDLRVGDKVVWFFEGYHEVGTVKWKGFVGSQINVGVEFERQLGLPIKDLNADALQCIFKSKPGHGRMIPVNELCLYDKSLLSNYSTTANLPKIKSSERVHCEFKHNGGGSSIKRLQICTHQ